MDALRDLTMDVEQHEVFGFVGPNGAGKTTTMKILMGLIHPTSGRAELFGYPLDSLEAKRRVGFLPEHPYFYDHLTGREILDFFARLFGLAAPERRKRADRLLERVGMAHAANQPLRSYSKGMLQRIGIAQALINDPDLVILDEPMSGLDPVGRKEVRDLMLELRAERRTVFFSTHILADVEVVCDRVLILDKGAVAAQAPLTELMRLAGDEVEMVITGAADASKILAGISGVVVTPAADRTIVRLPQADALKGVELIKAAGASVLSLTPARRTLEEIFLAKVTHREPQA